MTCKDLNMEGSIILAPVSYIGANLAHRSKKRSLRKLILSLTGLLLSFSTGSLRDSLLGLGGLMPGCMPQALLKLLLVVFAIVTMKTNNMSFVTVPIGIILGLIISRKFWLLSKVSLHVLALGILLADRLQNNLPDCVAPDVKPKLEGPTHIAFTDGAASRQADIKWRRAGFGVWCESDPSINCSKPLGGKVQTSIRAEITAVLYCVATASSPVHICCDCKPVVLHFGKVC